VSDAERLVARTLAALALGFLLAAIGYAVDSIVIWHDLAHGAPELGKVSVALGAALLVFEWSRRRSAKRAITKTDRKAL
jgi:ACR3 family arsenite efflux pump ArsB